MQELSYDAWGRRRDPSTWQYFAADTDAQAVNPWGFSGHEHIDLFGMVNMDGRMYDPMTGRFLSPDNYVQEPWNSQNFNRYSYCLNNPLKYTDPSGELFGIDDVLLLSMAVSMYTNILMSVGNGESVWKGALRGGVSAVTAIAGSYATNYIGGILGHTSQSWSTELMRAGMHGVINGAVNEANGSNFWNGFAIGFASSAVGSAVGSTGLSSDYVLPSMALSGGIVSQLTGGEFLFGAMDGIGIGMLNHRWEILPDGTPHRILDDVYVTGHYKGGIPLMTVTRFAETVNSTLSKYVIIAQNGNCSGYILERGGPETAMKNQNRRIPVGIYDMDYTYSPRFGKKLYLISNSVVGKDRGIRLHTGNYYYDSQVSEVESR